MRKHIIIEQFRMGKAEGQGLVFLLPGFGLGSFRHFGLFGWSVNRGTAIAMSVEVKYAAN